MYSVSIGCKSSGYAETGFPASDYKQKTGPRARTQDLRENVRDNLFGRKFSPGRKADGHSGIEVATRDMADRVSHGQNSQSESQRNTGKTDTKIGIAGRKHRATTSSKDEP